MASIFKNFGTNDITTTRTLLHEAVPITGTIVSGTYSDENIKDYAHGMFQSVYDYPYLSSSANHIFDITVGYSNSSPLSASTATQNAKKINIYNQMAQILVGHDVSGSIREFDQDGNILAGGNKIDSAMFFNFSRLLTKDEIKKGSFSITFLTGGNFNSPNEKLTLSDSGSTNSFKVNSPAGEYGLLYPEQAIDVASDVLPMGLVYYQAGIAVITSSVFGGIATYNPGATPGGGTNYFVTADGVTIDGTTVNHDNQVYSSIDDAYVSSSISGACNGIRNRLQKVSFNNTTELHSTIYFCRINHNEFNYSANPTYLTASKLRVKSESTDMPVSYITSIGLYSQSNELLAMAKLSEPLKKSPDNEITLRVRLDY
jgi:hypothetical protein